LALAARERCCPQRSPVRRALFTCICARWALCSSHISLSSLFPTTVRSLPFLDTPSYLLYRVSSFHPPASHARTAPPAAHTLAVAVAAAAPWPVVDLLLLLPSVVVPHTVLAPWIPSSRPARPRLAARFGHNPPSPPGIALLLVEQLAPSIVHTAAPASRRSNASQPGLPSEDIFCCDRRHHRPLRPHHEEDRQPDLHERLLRRRPLWPGPGRRERGRQQQPPR
jgi:hypothetical protein